MSDLLEPPEPQESPPQSWDPPSAPPIPPYAMLGAGEHDGPSPDLVPPTAALTAITWSLPVAALLCVALVAATVGAAVLAGYVRSLGITGSTLTLLMGAILSAAYLLLLGAVWLHARSHGARFADAVGMRSAPVGAYVGGTVLAVVAGRLAAGVWGVAAEYPNVPTFGGDIDPSRLFPADPAGVVTAFVVAVVLAPLAEEVLFRGVLLSAFYERWGAPVAIVGSSLLFSAMHLSPLAIPPIFVLALVLGWLFVRTRSLTVCVVAHSVFNGLGLAALYALKAAGLL